MELKTIWIQVLKTRKRNEHIQNETKQNQAIITSILSIVNRRSNY